MERSPYLPEVSAALIKQESRPYGPQEAASEKFSRLADLPPRFKEITEELQELTGAWNPVEIYTADPESIAAEKAAFFEGVERGEVYHPQLTYSHAEAMDVERAYERLLILLAEVKAEDFEKDNRIARVSRAALIAKIRDDMATCEMVRGIQQKNEALIKRAINEKYQPLDDSLLEVAYAVHERDSLPTSQEQLAPGSLDDSEKQYLKETMFKADEIAAAFIWALKRMDIYAEMPEQDGFRVEISNTATSIDVRDKSVAGPTIFIPITRKVTGKYLLNLLAHEIGSHARQSMNGKHLFAIGGGALKIDDETLYEGLAMRAERDMNAEMFGENAAVAGSLYTLGAEIASRGGSFHDVYQRIHSVVLHHKLKIHPTEDLPPLQDVPEKTRKYAQDEGWRATYRVMRGHTDMSNPEDYAMTKDLAYLRGQEIDRELQEVGLGHLNEAAILDGAGLRLVQEFNLQPEDLPIPNMNLPKLYWEEVLKPHMIRKKLQESE